MFIGLRKLTEYSDGTRIAQYVPFDDTFINGKIDYYEKAALEARKDLTECSAEDKDDFALKVLNSVGLTMVDFPVMRCIPRENFELFNVAGTTNRNSISLIFEQCGGKFSKAKEFPAVIKQNREIAIAEGLDPSEIPDDTWKWTDPSCLPGDSCDLGFELTPEEAA